MCVCVKRTFCDVCGTKGKSAGSAVASVFIAPNGKQESIFSIRKIGSPRHTYTHMVSRETFLFPILLPFFLCIPISFSVVLIRTYSVPASNKKKQHKRRNGGAPPMSIFAQNGSLGGQFSGKAFRSGKSEQRAKGVVR